MMFVTCSLVVSYPLTIVQCWPVRDVEIAWRRSRFHMLRQFICD